MSVFYVKGASLYICGHLNYTTILSWVQTNGAPTVVHTRVKSVFTLIHQTVNISFHPHSVMSVINGQLPQFSFFFFIFHLSRVFVVTCGTYLVAPLLSRRWSGDPLNLCFFFFYNCFFVTNLPLRVGSGMVYVLTGTVGLC